MDDQTDGQPHESIELAHPFGLEAGEVIVDGNDMDALAGKRVEDGGQRCGQGFALAGAHLGDSALMQHDAADHLHVERPLTQHAHGGFAHKRVGFRQQRIEIRSGLRFLFQILHVIADVVVGQRFHFGFERVDFIDGFPELFNLGVVIRAEEFANEIQHGYPPKRANRAKYSLIFPIIPQGRTLRQMLPRRIASAGTCCRVWSRRF